MHSKSKSFAGAVSQRRLQHATNRGRTRENHHTLAQLDNRLAEKLEVGAIRLVRVVWLIAQPPEYRMNRCQDLEKLERSGAIPSPLLTKKEAVDLLLKGSRSVGALSYGWLTSGHPDPAGARIEMLRVALDQHPHIEGLFWEYVPRRRIHHSMHTYEGVPLGRTVPDIPPRSLLACVLYASATLRCHSGPAARLKTRASELHWM